MIATRPNIVLVTVDSLRFDRLGCYGCALPTSPHVNELARSSYFFRNAFAVGPNTPHAFPAIMASRSPLVSRKLGLFDAPITLAEILQESGYHTLGFNAGNPYVSRYFKYDRGFEIFQDYIDFEVPLDSDRSSSGISIPQLEIEHYAVTEASVQQKIALEATFMDEVFSMLRQISKHPFFLWLHLMDPHYPYVPRRAVQKQVTGETVPFGDCLSLNQLVRESAPVESRQLEQIQLLYDAAVRQADEKIGAVMAYLKQMDLYEDAFIVFTADHGEEFREHGDLQHLSKLYDELIRVPLLLKFPGQQHRERADELFSLIGLAPTLLSGADLAHPFGDGGFFDSMNRSEKSAAGAAVFADTSYGANGGSPTGENLLRTDVMPKRCCIRNSRYKLILDTDSTTPEFYKLLEDPEERFPEKTDTPEARALHLQLQDHMTAVARTRVRAEVRALRSRLNLPKNEDYAVRLS